MSTSARSQAPRPSDSGLPAAPATGFVQTYVEDVLASLGNGLILLDLEKHVVFLSHTAEDLTGVSMAHAAERPAGEAFASQPWLAETIAALDPRDPHRVNKTGDLRTRFGRRATVRVTAAPIVDVAGAIVGISLLFHDLATQRPLGETAERGTRVENLAAVAAGLAHEVKNPLGGIKGAAQILAERLQADADASRFTALITREVDRVSALLEQLLELTRPPRLRLGAVNVHRLLQEVLLLEGATATDALRVDCRFDPSLPAVWGDEAALRQVFLNLTKNALDAMGRAGILTVTTRMETDFHLRYPAWSRSRKFLSVEIEDTGPGIPPEDLERIFTPFFTTKASGTGLGLAVSHRLITQHGGLVQVESEPGRGSSFRVSLPVAPHGTEG
jgi:two-component system, NtrC family, nitrogen regulation sensor histidine kinase GlnL